MTESKGQVRRLNTIQKCLCARMPTPPPRSTPTHSRAWPERQPHPGALFGQLWWQEGTPSVQPAAFSPSGTHLPTWFGGMSPLYWLPIHCEASDHHMSPGSCWLRSCPTPERTAGNSGLCAVIQKGEEESAHFELSTVTVGNYSRSHQMLL